MRKIVIEEYNGDLLASLESFVRRNPGLTIVSASERHGGLVLEVKQKYPTVPTRDFLLIKVEPNQKNFSILAGNNRRRIYQGSTQGDRIVSNYFDGNFAVFVCQKRTFVFGPGNPDKPQQNWRLINSFSSH